MRRVLSLDFLTSLAELAGGALVIAGAFVLFGLGVALLAAGAGLIVAGYLASGGAE